MCATRGHLRSAPPAMFLLVAYLSVSAWAAQIASEAAGAQLEALTGNLLSGVARSAATQSSHGAIRRLMQTSPQTISEAYQEQVLEEEQSGFGFKPNAHDVDSAAMAGLIDERLTQQVKASADPAYQPVRDHADRLTAAMRQMLPDMVDACTAGAESWMWLDAFR